MFGGDHADGAAAVRAGAVAGSGELGARSGEMWTLAVLGLARGLAGRAVRRLRRT